MNWVKVKGAFGAVEKKVLAATGITTLMGLAVAVDNNLHAHAELLGSLPAWLQAALLTGVPGVLTAVAGYAAPHTPRPDLAPATPAAAPGAASGATPPGPGA